MESVACRGDLERVAVREDRSHHDAAVDDERGETIAVRVEAAMPRIVVRAAAFDRRPPRGERGIVEEIQEDRAAGSVRRVECRYARLQRACAAGMAVGGDGTRVGVSCRRSKERRWARLCRGLVWPAEERGPQDKASD